MKRKIFLVAGLGYGDEGKGSIVDFLSSAYPVKGIWRYNGGAQAAHHIVSQSGISHCFAQFGSGLLSASANTYLSRFMVVNPLNLLKEYEVLTGKIEGKIPITYIDSRAIVITPYQISLNRLREHCRGKNRLGSCGMGVGETMRDYRRFPDEAICAGDLMDKNILRRKLNFWRSLKIDQAEQIIESNPTESNFLLDLDFMRSDGFITELVDEYLNFLFHGAIRIFEDVEDLETLQGKYPDGDLVFEGAQGMLIDRERGFYPHLTQSDVSFQNAYQIIEEQGLEGEVIKVGVLRAYATRHGAGPFVTEEDSLSSMLPEMDNKHNEWQGKFRVGWFDAVASRYALKAIGGVDCLALTCLDRLLELEEVKVCSAYKYYGNRATDEVEEYFDCIMDRINKRLYITGIKLLSETEKSDEKIRLMITEILNDCQPDYEEVKVGENFIDGYVKLLEKRMGVKITLISTGPTAGDKQVISPLS